MADVVLLTHQMYPTSICYGSAHWPCQETNIFNSQANNLSLTCIASALLLCQNSDVYEQKGLKFLFPLSDWKVSLPTKHPTLSEE